MTPGGLIAQGNHRSMFWAIIWAAWPDREPGWPTFLGGGAMLYVTDAAAKKWLPRALRAALINWRYRPRNLPPPLP